ncbi:MAG: Ig-like domain-containing protein [Lachnospiraceae bacterium]|nr:Ig-like domain-containing protein [Lachnospiraceae bacterium]
MQSYKDKILKSGKSILSILLAVLLINQGIVAEAAAGAQTATPNEKTASVEAQKPQSFILNTVKQTIGVKGTCKISVKKATPQNADKSVRYQSKNTKIATVNSKGVVTGKKLGKTKIVVTAMQNKKLKKYVTIEVKNLKPTKLTLNAKNVKIKYGDKYQLIAKVRPQNMYCPVVFSSNNKKVATIDKNGVIRGKKAGTATITARTKYKNKKGKYLYKKCTVKVSHNYKLVKSVNPTCEKAGYKKYKCDCCNKISTTKLKATGHKWKTLEEIKPTCENSGQKKEECSNCHKVKITKLKATGHDYSIIIEKKEATDDEDGYLITKCKVCGKTNRQTLTKDRTYTIDLGNGKTTTVVGHYEREMEEEMFNAVNQYRRDNNISELGPGYYKLKNAADIRAYEIAYYFEHIRPNGERALVSFSMYHCCCENIAKGQQTVEKAMNDFKNSKRHNAGMLCSDFEYLSVSIFAEYQYTVNGKKQYKLHYVQFYGLKPYSSQL